ncbi:MAG: SpoIIIAH-like family protein [Lachnospiraceae bacterium]|nr:SpoIIIAH-like family protein [Lachnospiraceae bacterium]
MVAVAGYLSITETDELSMTASNDSVTDSEVADISEEDIVLDEGEAASAASVSAAGVSEDTAASAATASPAGSGSTASRDNAGEAVLVSNTVGSSYFEEAKLSREQTRAKNKETLTNLVNNQNTTAEQRDKAMNEIMKMTAISEKETATENLLAAKGFQEAVVTIVDDSVDVIVNAEDLTQQQIAQIEDVVKRKTECSADKIVISPVGKNK